MAGGSFGGGGGGGTPVTLTDDPSGVLTIDNGAGVVEQAQRPISELADFVDPIDCAADKVAIYDASGLSTLAAPMSAFDVTPTFNVGTNVLTLTGPCGAKTVDLSGLAVDINVGSFGFDPATGALTLTETDGTVHSVDLTPALIQVTDEANGTMRVNASSGGDQSAIRPIDELIDLPTGQLDPVNDEVVIWDASTGNHVAVKVADLRAPIQVTYYDTVTAPAAVTTPRTVVLPTNGNNLHSREYGVHAIIDGEVWSAGQFVNGTAGPTNGAGEAARLPAVVPAQMQRPDNDNPVGRIPKFTKLWVNARNAFYLDGLGRVWHRGSNLGRQSGIPSYAIGDANEIPTLIPFFEDNAITITNLEVSGNRLNDDYPSVYAVSSTGRLYVWGRNNSGQLGLGSTADTPTPTLVGGLLATKTVIQVTAGGSNGEHALVLCSDGSLYGAGAQPSGELGIGSVLQQNTWVLCRTGVAFAIASQDASFVIDVAGKVWAAGNNNQGWFGRGNTANSTSWVQSTSFTGVADQIYIGSAAQSSIFIRENANLWVGGANVYSQLGLGAGSAVQQNNHVLLTAAQAPFQGSVKDVQIAGAATPTVYVLTTAGHLWSAGYNGYGQRGLGNRLDTAAYRSRWLRAAWHRAIQVIRVFGYDNSGNVVILDELGRLAECSWDQQSFDSTGNWSSAFRNYPIVTY